MLRSVLVPATPLCRLPSLPPFPSALPSSVPSSPSPFSSSIFSAFFLLFLPSLLPFSSSLMPSVSSSSFFFRLFFLLSRLQCLLPPFSSSLSSSVSFSSFLFSLCCLRSLLSHFSSSLMPSSLSYSSVLFFYAVFGLFFLLSLLSCLQMKNVQLRLFFRTTPVLQTAPEKTVCADYPNPACSRLTA